MGSEETPAGTPSELDLTLHIGAGKTGTSSIQHLLHVNRARLAERGYLYPRSPGTRRHTRLGLFVKPDQEIVRYRAWVREGADDPATFRRQFRRRLLREIQRSGLSRVLFSDEGLWGSSDRALVRLRRLTDLVAREVRVVAYVRRQDDLLLSRYQQEVKAGEVRRLREWAGREHPRIFDYRDQLGRWAEAYGDERIVLRRFESSRFTGGSLYEDFFEACGLDVDLADLEPVPDRNESLDAESVELLRLLNLVRMETDGVTARDLDNRDYATALVASSDQPPLALPHDEMVAFWERWAEPNREVAARFLGEQDAELFTQPRRERPSRSEQVLDPARVDHFVELLDLPERWQQPLADLAEREARSPA